MLVSVVDGGGLVLSALLQPVTATLNVRHNRANRVNVRFIGAANFY